MTLTPAGPPRGLIHHDPSRARFQHARYLPATDLAAFVEHYWTVQWDLRGQAPHVQSTLPHPSVHLVLEDGHSRIVGIQRGRFTQTLDGRGAVFGVKFRPGGFHGFLRHPIKGCPPATFIQGCPPETLVKGCSPRRESPTRVSQLTGRTLDAAGVFGEDVRSLEHDVDGANHESMVAAAERFLRARLPPPDPLATRAGAIVTAILADRAVTRVGQVAARTGLTERQLQRLFSRYVGVSPKWVIQRYRLHEALDRVDHGEIVDWASLAADLGYFDQPHFIRDFRRMVGQTPAEYRAKRAGRGQT